MVEYVSYYYSLVIEKKSSNNINTISKLEEEINKIINLLRTDHSIQKQDFKLQFSGEIYNNNNGVISSKMKNSEWNPIFTFECINSHFKKNHSLYIYSARKVENYDLLHTSLTSRNLCISSNNFFNQ